MQDQEMKEAIEEKFPHLEEQEPEVQPKTTGRKPRRDFTISPPRRVKRNRKFADPKRPKRAVTKLKAKRRAKNKLAHASMMKNRGK